MMVIQGTYTYEYPRPAVTTDCVLFCQDHEEGLSVLLIERGGEPYKGCWAFPGGFLEMDETVEEGAVRELREETGLVLSPEDGRSDYRRGPMRSLCGRNRTNDNGCCSRL